MTAWRNTYNAGLAYEVSERSKIPIVAICSFNLKSVVLAKLGPVYLLL